MEKCVNCNNSITPIKHYFSELTDKLECPVCFVVWYKGKPKTQDFYDRQFEYMTKEKSYEI